MSSMNEELRRRLVARFGPSINLESNSSVIRELLDEIDFLNPNIVADDQYDRTYTEGYNKEDYSKGSYSRYDKTNDEWDESIRERIQPELDKLVVEGLRSQFRSP